MCMHMQAYKDASETEMAKKGQTIGTEVSRSLIIAESSVNALAFSLSLCLSLSLSLSHTHTHTHTHNTQFAKEAQKTAEKVSQTAGAIAEEVAKTDVGQAIRKVSILLAQ